MAKTRDIRRTLVLGGLWAFAVGQPGLEFLREHPQFLIAHGARGGEIALVVLLLTLLPPLALSGLVALLGRAVRPAATLLFWVLGCALLLGTVVPPTLRLVPAEGQFAALGGLALVSLTMPWLAARSQLVRRALEASIVGLPVFLLLFLVDPNVRAHAASARAVVGSGAGQAPSVVMVVLDALPLSSLLTTDGAIDDRLYPNFARLQRQSIWFRNGTAAADRTVIALPALLTGKRSRVARPHLAEHPHNLFTLLAGSHDIFAQERTTKLCPRETNLMASGSITGRTQAILSDLRWVLAHTVTPERWRHRLPAVDTGWKDFGLDQPRRDFDGDYRAGDVHHFLANLRPGRRPGVYFLHLMLPHLPYVYLPEGQIYSRSGQQWGARLADPHTRNRNPWIVLQSYQRHLLQLRHTDRVLGDILDRLAGTGLLESSVVVVTADHGESFVPGRSPREVTAGNAHDILHVPLFLRLPGAARGGEISSRNVELVDILPTLAQVLGFQLPGPVEGSSMLDPSVPERPEKLVISGWKSPRPWRTSGQLDPRVQTTVSQRVEVFGDGHDPAAIYRLGDDLGMIGRGVDEFAVVTVEQPTWRLMDPQLFEHVARDEGFIPAEVTGVIDPAYPRQRLAIAVNGQIEAVTQPATNWTEVAAAPWTAMVNPRALHDGRNRVEAFLIDSSTTPVQLARCTAEPLGIHLGVRMGGVPVLGVTEYGFKNSVNPAYRWMQRRGSLELATPTPPPTRLQLKVVDGGGAGTDVVVRVNGTVVYEGRIQNGSWNQTFSLDGVKMSDRIKIVIEAERHTLEGSPPPRDHEILPVQSVRLLP